VHQDHCRVCIWLDEGVQEYGADAASAYRFADAALLAGFTVSIDNKYRDDLRPLSWSIVGR
jgi:hypothetical protein